MFSAIYLVCLAENLVSFVDPLPYPTEEVCELEAMNIIACNKQNLTEIPPFKAEYQCIIGRKHKDWGAKSAPFF